MSDLVKKGLSTLKEGVHALKTLKADKQAYQAYVARTKALPEEYQYVYEKMTQYMWGQYGGWDGQDLMGLQADLLELLEGSAAEGKPVYEVTGEDVAGFCDALLQTTPTHTEHMRKKLNQEIARKCKGPTLDA